MNNLVFKDYFAKLDKTQQLQLEQIISIVKELIPDAQAVISYGIPGFKYKGKYLLGFAAFKHHLSLFPTSGPIEIYKDKLIGYKTARGTIQFTADHPLPKSLLKKIILLRLLEINQEYP